MIRLYRSLMFISLVVAGIAFILIMWLHVPGLRFLSILPVGYLIAASLLLRFTWSTGPSLFLVISLPTMFLRYVAFPSLVLINNGYKGRSLVPPAEESFDLAIFLMSYELLLVSLLIVMLEVRYHRARRVQDFEMRTQPLWHLFVVVVFAILLTVAFPASSSLIQILKPEIVSNDTAVSMAAANLTALVVITVKTFVFLALMRRLAQARSWRVLATWAGGLLCMLNIAVYFGVNRLAVVLTVMASIWVFRRLFGSRSNTQIGTIAIMSIFLFALITSERKYVSYTESRLVSIADTIQVYTGGVYNVAIGVEVETQFPVSSSLSVLALDFLRPTIGVNMIVRNWDVFYSNVYFNKRLWGDVDRRSQIIPMIAQGNLFFPVAFAPLISLFFTWLAYKFLNIMIRVRYIEIQYCLALVIMRLGFFWGQNSMNLMSYISFNLLLPLLLLSLFMLIRKLYKEKSRGITKESIESSKLVSHEGARL